MKPSEKSYQTRVYSVCRNLAETLSKLPLNSSPAAVVAAFTETGKSRRLLSEAFTLMDREPHRFVDNKIWHPKLRSCRNHPVHGPELFALFN